MKIIIVTSAAFAHGGVSRVMESWARVLGAGGHSVSVLTPVTDDAIPLPALEGVGAAPFEVPESATRWHKIRAIAAAAVREMVKIDRSEPIDLVLTHDAYLAPRIRQAFPRIPQLLTIHSPFVDENRLTNWKYTREMRRRLTYPGTWAIAWLTERQGLRAASAAHTLSEYTWNLLRNRHAAVCARTPWQRIPGTFDQRRFVPAKSRRQVREQLGLPADRRILLTVRRLVPRNGVDRILAAASRLRSNENVTFLIGGAGKLLDALRRRVEVESLQATVKFLGLVPEADLPGYYQASDAFVLPTRDLECFGLPVIEAMACGCTPLVMPDGGPAEVCRPFPECVAAANTTEAFVDLVASYLSGGIPVAGEKVSSYAHGEFSEEAIQPAILDVADRLGRNGV